MRLYMIGVHRKMCPLLEREACNLKFNIVWGKGKKVDIMGSRGRDMRFVQLNFFRLGFSWGICAAVIFMLFRTLSMWYKCLPSIFKISSCSLPKACSCLKQPFSIFFWLQPLRSSSQFQPPPHQTIHNNTDKHKILFSEFSSCGLFHICQGSPGEYMTPVEKGWFRVREESKDIFWAGGGMS